MSKIADRPAPGRDLSREEHLMQVAEEARAAAAELPPGAARDALMRKARRSETAAHTNDWINSPGLRPPA